MIIEAANRTKGVSEYYFSRKLQEIEAINRSGERVINLGIGSPDMAPASGVIRKLVEGAENPDNHAYQSYKGIRELREAFASWYEKYYRVVLDPATEIQPLAGSKEGILLLSLAFLNRGDKVLVPDPGYPTYSSATLLTEAEIMPFDLKEDNGWKPDFEALEAMDLSGVKMMWVNYPNMPTGARADRELYERLVEFGRRHRILICNDNPYSFILNEEHLSILSVEGAKTCCIELNSLSKAHNMAGWRIGMIAGDKEVIANVLKVKSNMDSGMFRPMQLAAAEALGLEAEWYERLNAEYRKRKALAGEIFDALGAEYDPGSGGMFLWGKIGGKWENGEKLSDYVLQKARVFITPGFIFGSNGRQYIRLSLCAKQEVLKEALERIKRTLNAERLKHGSWC